MYEFVDKLFNFALPRVRDFKGINPDAFDGRGNYSMGIKEQLIFPEIEYDKVDKIRGMDICIVTKHVRPRRQGEEGGIIKTEGALYACKVQPFCAKCNKGVRVAHKVVDGKKVRVCAKCGEIL